MPEKTSTLLGTLIGAILFFFIFLFVFAKFGPAIPFSVNQVTTTQSNLFSVTGEGKVTAVPDTAEVSLGFTSQGSSVSQVQSQANSVINKITSAVKNLGVGDKDIQTSQYSLQPNYDFNSGSQKITGYSANVNLTVKVHDFSKINQVIDAGTANGANQVGSLSFTVADPEKYRSQARQQAIDQAKQKAQSLASQTGISLGRIINVTETSDNPIPPRVFDTMAVAKAAPDQSTQVQPGTSEITSIVTLSYETR